MTGDQYLQSILQKYAVNTVAAQSAANAMAPAIQKWTGRYLSSLTYSGSFAKGTANNIGTDVDLFIFLSPDTPETLAQIYESLFNLATQQIWHPRAQNASVGVSYAGMKVDLVPGRIQTGYQNVHSLYKSKTDS